MGKSIRLREQQQIWRPSGCDRFASMMALSSHVAIFERFESVAVLNLILPQAELKEMDLKLRTVPFHETARQSEHLRERQSLLNEYYISTLFPVQPRKFIGSRSITSTNGKRNADKKPRTRRLGLTATCI